MGEGMFLHRLRVWLKKPSPVAGQVANDKMDSLTVSANV
jgi:hypothetical protein